MAWPLLESIDWLSLEDPHDIPLEIYRNDRMRFAVVKIAALHTAVYACTPSLRMNRPPQGRSLGCIGASADRKSTLSTPFLHDVDAWLLHPRVHSMSKLGDDRRRLLRLSQQCLFRYPSSAIVMRFYHDRKFSRPASRNRQLSMI